MIKILYPKPGEVSRMGGLQLLEVEADTEAEIMALRARIDDGVQTFVAAPGSVAHTPDHSADWEFSPAGTWVKRGGGTPYDRVILPETVLSRAEDDGYFLQAPWVENITPGGTYAVTFNGTEYICTAVDYMKVFPDAEGAPEGMCALGNLFDSGMPEKVPNAPFMLVAMTNATGASTGVYGGITPVDTSMFNSVPSVTLSVTKKGETASASGNFVVNVIIGTMDETGTTGTCTFDKSYAETLAAVKAGCYVTCRLPVEGVFILPAVLYGEEDGAVSFGLYMANTFMSVVMHPDGTGAIDCGTDE